MKKRIVMKWENNEPEERLGSYSQLEKAFGKTADQSSSELTGSPMGTLRWKIGGKRSSFNEPHEGGSGSGSASAPAPSRTSNSYVFAPLNVDLKYAVHQIMKLICF